MRAPRAGAGTLFVVLVSIAGGCSSSNSGTVTCESSSGEGSAGDCSIALSGCNDGHSYLFTCTSGTTCTCTLDGRTTRTVAGATCGAAAANAACGWSLAAGHAADAGVPVYAGDAGGCTNEMMACTFRDGGATGTLWECTGGTMPAAQSCSTNTTSICLTPSTPCVCCD